MNRTYISVTHTSTTLSNSGIQRVVRNLSREWMNFGSCEFIHWNHKNNNFYPVDPFHKNYKFNEYGGPPIESVMTDWKQSEINSQLKAYLYRFLRIVGKYKKRSKVPLKSFKSIDKRWLILPELMTGEVTKNCIQFAKNHGFKTAALFYDAIPIEYPSWVNEQIRINHADYMKHLSDCDIILPISISSSEAFSNFCIHEGLKCPKLSPVLLPGEFPNNEPPKSYSDNNGKIKNILMVASLEARKNHERVIYAFNKISEKHPDTKLQLVGSAYKGGDSVKALVNSAIQRNKNIIWHGRASDNELKSFYQSAKFTIFPSMAEGFGLPILESLFYGKPCITSDQSVMAELAKDGGCLTADVFSIDNLAEKMDRLLSDPSLYRRLIDEAKKRIYKTWYEYTSEIIATLDN